MRFLSLSQWLTWQENLHFTEIDPGLERIAEVWQRMAGSKKLPFKVITVAGTNGKGSSVALTSAILQAAGYKVGTYTSPHLLKYNERISINGEPCYDIDICHAFDRIDTARAEISLTYFEFATLAAVDLFIRHDVDVAILEVGMGGRLDAVNLFDADIALITPIGLDHTAWLGDNREKIGYEKAGIIRHHQLVICSESSPPDALLQHAEHLQARSYVAGREFDWKATRTSWHWHNNTTTLEHLPFPALRGRYQLQNAAAVIQICQLLNVRGMPVSEMAIRQGLQQVTLLGRFQVVSGPVPRILDVTHNQQGAANLKLLLQEMPSTGKTYAVLAMLKDKDSRAVAAELNEVVDFWYLAGLEGERGMTAEQLAAGLTTVINEQQRACYRDVAQAYQAAMRHAVEGDQILIFGSFHTVEAMLYILSEEEKIK